MLSAIMVKKGEEVGQPPQARVKKWNVWMYQASFYFILKNYNITKKPQNWFFFSKKSGLFFYRGFPK